MSDAWMNELTDREQKEVRFALLYDTEEFRQGTPGSIDYLLIAKLARKIDELSSRPSTDANGYWRVRTVETQRTRTYPFTETKLRYFLVFAESRNEAAQKVRDVRGRGTNIDGIRFLGNRVTDDQRLDVIEVTQDTLEG